jgi:hypothetical protein
VCLRGTLRGVDIPDVDQESFGWGKGEHRKPRLYKRDLSAGKSSGFGVEMWGQFGAGRTAADDSDFHDTKAKACGRVSATVIGHTSAMGSSLTDAGIVVGTARTERADAIALVRRWFDNMSARDLPGASKLMSSTMSIVISGGYRFSRLEDFAAFGADRYASVHKQTDHFEVCEAAGGVAVYVRGEMSGAWKDGKAFAGVRWCDRFLVSSGAIVDLQTWSDLAETRLR